MDIISLITTSVGAADAVASGVKRLATSANISAAEIDRQLRTFIASSPRSIPLVDGPSLLVIGLSVNETFGLDIGDLGDNRIADGSEHTPKVRLDFPGVNRRLGRRQSEVRDG